MSTLDPNLLSELILPSLRSDPKTSLQKQIYKALQQAILSGALGAGHRLPSTRQLALELGISRITVTLAYDKLSAEGYIATAKGSGTFVADTHPLIYRELTVAHPQVRDLDECGLSMRAKRLVRSTHGGSQQSGAFVPGISDTLHFPFHLWQRMQNRYTKKPHSALTGYGTGGGYAPLRRALAEYLQISRSVKCTPEQVIITMGTNQSLDLCALMLADAQDVALIEEPCNWSTALIWRAADLKVKTLGLDEDGLRLQDFPFAETHASEHPKLVFTTPSHQYPMGGAMSLQRRRLLIELARRYNFWIIEDDYDSEFRYDTNPLPSLQGLDHHERVIYLGTFSKVMYPGLRMSYLVVPQSLAQSFASGLNQLFRPGQLSLQAAMSDFITEGYFASHVRRMRGIYAERQHELKRSLDSHFGDVIHTSGGNAGLHLTTRFHNPVDINRMTAFCDSRGVALRDLALYYQGQSPMAGYVLGYGGIATEQVDAAVQIMAEGYDLALQETRYNPAR